VTLCQFFGRYTVEWRGSCARPADYKLARQQVVAFDDDLRIDAANPPILVCTHHAMVIVSNFPGLGLGRVHERFEPIR
jgi:hypothetical protein